MRFFGVMLSGFPPQILCVSFRTMNYKANFANDPTARHIKPPINELRRINKDDTKSVEEHTE